MAFGKAGEHVWERKVGWGQSEYVQGVRVSLSFYLHGLWINGNLHHPDLSVRPPSAGEAAQEQVGKVPFWVGARPRVSSFIGQCNPAFFCPSHQFGRLPGLFPTLAGQLATQPLPY